MADRALDLVCLGRVSVDLYSEQVGGPLEDVRSFAKYVGGCPANIAIGGARLGLRTALLSRVGDEQMGRFVRRTLVDEGVDVSLLTSDRERLTALVILGIRDRQRFPHIFYRENCADMALTENDVDPAAIARARALLVTGTHFSTGGVAAASHAAIAAARAAGTRIVFDIDFRPVLWGLTGHGEGEARAGLDERVRDVLCRAVSNCDLIVGTEEEVCVLGGSADPLVALRALRDRTDAVLVLKRGPMGCQVFPGPIPNRLEAARLHEGFAVPVFNTLGAGDGFMSGFLRGWLRDEPLATCARYANACGAIVVSRHGCAPAMPSWEELQAFIERPRAGIDAGGDGTLEALHWKSLLPPVPHHVTALAFDHRRQLEDLAEQSGAAADRIPRLKLLLAEGARRAMEGRPGRGAIIDGRYGRDALDALTGEGWWLARPVERPGSRPLAFEVGPDIGLALRAWPSGQIAKCLVLYHPDDEEALREEQCQALLALQRACRASQRELLVEVIPPATLPQDGSTLERAIEQLYGAGVVPDWWKLPPPGGADEWERIGRLIDARDPHCRGVLLLGLEASEADLAQSFAVARSQRWCRGFAIGRTVFASPSRAWFAGELDDAGLVDAVAEAYGRLVELWSTSRVPETGNAG